MSKIPNFKFLIENLYPYDVRLVGGAVRDILMGKTPSDYDFSTNASPQQVIDKIRHAGGKVAPTGIQHGTVTVTYEGISCEITTLRIDKRTDGRWAEIEFTNDWKSDAARRDFTINSMSMDIHGKIYDYFDGQKDLEDGVVRFVGDAGERIREDYLRIMRYFRFVGRIENNHVYDYDTLKTIANNIHGIDIISGERIANELGKIIVNYNRNNVLSMMNDVGLLKQIRIPYWITHISNYARLSKDKAKYELILASLFRNTNEFDSFYERVKITGAQKKLGEYLIRNSGTDLTLHGLIRKIYNGHKSDYLLDLAIFLDDKAAISMIEGGFYPKFLLTEQDVSKLNIPRKKIKTTYNDLLEKWIDSSFRVSKEQLLSTVGVE
jgi:tRNA nucleotidyltransferase (CCA-adding enzyme)